MEYNELAAKRRKKHKSYCFYAPFASLRGYSLFRFCSLCYGLFSNCLPPTLYTFGTETITFGHQNYGPCVVIITDLV